MIDFCRLCGKEKEMTFEHVPPRTAFNKRTKYQIVSLIDIFKKKNPLDYSYKSKVQQGGVGYYSLCKECNSFLGSKYVPAYNSYSNTFIEFAKKTGSVYFEFEMHDFEVLKVLKQTVAMFLAINSTLFSEKNRSLAEFVLDYESQNLPEQYRLFIYLNSEGQLRNIPLMVKGNLESGVSTFASEIAFPPLGHVLSISSNRALPFHFEITNFKSAKINERKNVLFKVNRLPTFLPILLDYRDKSEIQNSIFNPE